MSNQDDDRRFTDREVAVVLRRAAELDEVEGKGSGGGLSIKELREIAAEVGIDPEMVTRAVGELGSGRFSPEDSLFGAPISRKAVRAVPGHLSREAMAELIQHVDDSTSQAGVVSEALGSVRWTGTDRFRTTQVTIGETQDETTIQVLERFPGRVRRVAHLIPGAWGFVLGSSVAAAWGVTGSALILPWVGGTLLGVGAGRAAWQFLAARRDRRVRELADSLTQAARNAAQPIAALGEGGEE